MAAGDNALKAWPAVRAEAAHCTRCHLYKCATQTVRAVFGKTMTIASLRGRGHDLPDGGEAWATVHPSFLLRVRDEDRKREHARFVEDLRRIGRRAKERVRTLDPAISTTRRETP